MSDPVPEPEGQSQQPAEGKQLSAVDKRARFSKASVTLETINVKEWRRSRIEKQGSLIPSSQHKFNPFLRAVQRAEAAEARGELKDAAMLRLEKAQSSYMRNKLRASVQAMNAVKLMQYGFVQKTEFRSGFLKIINAMLVISRLIKQLKAGPKSIIEQNIVSTASVANAKVEEAEAREERRKEALDKLAQPRQREDFHNLHSKYRKARRTAKSQLSSRAEVKKEEETVAPPRTSRAMSIFSKRYSAQIDFRALTVSDLLEHVPVLQRLDVAKLAGCDPAQSPSMYLKERLSVPLLTAFLGELDYRIEVLAKNDPAYALLQEKPDLLQGLCSQTGVFTDKEGHENLQQKHAQLQLRKQRKWFGGPSAGRLDRQPQVGEGSSSASSEELKYKRKNVKVFQDPKIKIKQIMARLQVRTQVQELVDELDFIDRLLKKTTDPEVLSQIRMGIVQAQTKKFRQEEDRLRKEKEAANEQFLGDIKAEYVDFVNDLNRHTLLGEDHHHHLDTDDLVSEQPESDSAEVMSSEFESKRPRKTSDARHMVGLDGSKSSEFEGLCLEPKDYHKLEQYVSRSQSLPRAAFDPDEPSPEQRTGEQNEDGSDSYHPYLSKQNIKMLLGEHPSGAPSEPKCAHKKQNSSLDRELPSKKLMTEIHMKLDKKHKRHKSDFQRFLEQTDIPQTEKRSIEQEKAKLKAPELSQEKTLRFIKGMKMGMNAIQQMVGNGTECQKFIKEPEDTDKKFAVRARIQTGKKAEGGPTPEEQLLSKRLTTSLCQEDPLPHQGLRVAGRSQSVLGLPAPVAHRKSLSMPRHSVAGEPGAAAEVQLLFAPHVGPAATSLRSRLSARNPLGAALLQKLKRAKQEEARFEWTGTVTADAPDVFAQFDGGYKPAFPVPGPRASILRRKSFAAAHSASFRLADVPETVESSFEFSNDPSSQESTPAKLMRLTTQRTQLQRGQRQLSEKVKATRRRLISAKLFSLQDALKVSEVRRKEILQLNPGSSSGHHNLGRKLEAQGSRFGAARQGGDKFVTFLQDSHYHFSLKQKVEYPERRTDARKLCLQNKQIGPQQLNAILTLLSKNAKAGDQRVVSLDLSQNDLGERGVLCLSQWLEKEQLYVDKGTVESGRSAFASRRFSADLSDAGLREPLDAQSLSLDVENLDFDPETEEHCSQAKSSESFQASDDRSHSFISSEDEKEQIHKAFIREENPAALPTKKKVSWEVKEKIQILSPPVKAASGLVSLNLGQVNAPPSAFLALFKALSLNSTVTTIIANNTSKLLRNGNFDLALISEGIAPMLTQPWCVLDTLNLQGCNIAGSGLRALRTALVKNETLLFLNLEDNLLTGVDAAQDVAGVISSCTQLMTLNISHNNFGSKGIQVILAALALSSSSGLKKLSIESCGMSVIQEIVSAEDLSLGSGMQLEVVNLSGNPLKEGLGANIKVFQQFEAQDLGLNWALHKRSGENVDASNHVQRNTTISNDSLTVSNQSSGEAPSRRHKDRFERLNRASSLLEASVIRLGVLLLPQDSLKEINLEGCQLGDLGVQAFLKCYESACKPEQLRLNLAKNQITNKSISFIVNTVLKVDPKKVREDEPIPKRKLVFDSLNLSGNCLKSDPACSSKKVILGPAVSQQAKLEHSRFRFARESLGCIMKRFAALLQEQIFIENLDLSHNDDLGDDFGSFLLKYMKELNAPNIPLFQLPKYIESSLAQRPGEPALQKKQLIIFENSQHQLLQEKKELHNITAAFRTHKLLLNLDLSGCCVRIQTINAIKELLRENYQHRAQLEKVLELKNHSMLLKQGQFIRKVELDAIGKKKELRECKRELDKLRPFFRGKKVNLLQLRSGLQRRQDDLAAQDAELEETLAALAKQEKEQRQVLEEAQKRELGAFRRLRAVNDACQGELNAIRSQITTLTRRQETLLKINKQFKKKLDQKKDSPHKKSADAARRQSTLARAPIEFAQARRSVHFARPAKPREQEHSAEGQPAASLLLRSQTVRSSPAKTARQSTAPLKTIMQAKTATLDYKHMNRDIPRRKHTERRSKPGAKK